MGLPISRPWTAIFAVLLAVGGAAWVVLITARYGPAVTPDGVNYLAAAHSLARGQGVNGFSGEPLTLWPPLYPVLLAALSVPGVEPLTAARVVGAAAFGLILLTVGGWLRARGCHPAWAVLGMLAVACSDHLLLAGHVLSETLFVLLVLFALICAGRYRRTSSGAALAAFAGFSALAFLTRYAGVALLLTGVALLLLRRGAALRTRVREAMLYGGIAAVPVALWLVRNDWLTGAPMGVRGVGDATLGDNLAVVAATVLGWVWPPSAAPGALLLIARLSVLALLVAATWAAWAAGRRGGMRVPAELVPYAVFVAVYSGFLLLVRTFEGGAGIEPRFLLPLHAPLVMMAVWGLSRLPFPPDATPRDKRTWTVVVPVLTGIWLASYPAMKSAGLSLFAFGEGAGGYATTTWQRMHLSHFLKEQPPQGIVYSNTPDLVWLLTRTPARFTPLSTVWDSPAGRASFRKELQAALAGDEPVYLVWYDEQWRTRLADREALAAGLDLQTVVRFRDRSGVVYRVRGVTPDRAAVPARKAGPPG